VTPAAVKPSPEGVAGAVADPRLLQAEDITFAGAGGTPVSGYLVRPAAPGTLPGMIVIHEAGGLGEHIRDVANRIAVLGHVVLAPDLYTREGGPPPLGDIEAVMKRLFSMSDATVLGDLGGVLDNLLAREDVSGRVGCIGFCMGGRHTLMLACTSDRLSAAVDCWGGFIDRATLDAVSTPERPTPPLTLAGKLKCPLLAAVGAEDANPSPEIGAQLLERASASGQPVQLDVYEGAGHAFFADYRPSYRPEPAAQLWRRVVPFLARHLGGDRG
jgi:carboxymethylenebutenolidase